MSYLLGNFPPLCAPTIVCCHRRAYAIVETGDGCRKRVSPSMVVEVMHMLHIYIYLYVCHATMLFFSNFFPCFSPTTMAALVQTMSVVVWTQVSFVFLYLFIYIY